MSQKPIKHFKKKTKNILRGLSLRRDEYFVHNLVIGVGVIMIRVGVWWILDIYLVDYGVVWRIVCIMIGILLLYLVDGGIDQLWGRWWE